MILQRSKIFHLKDSTGTKICSAYAVFDKIQNVADLELSEGKL